MAHYKETHKGAMGVDFTLHLEGDQMVYQHSQDAGPALRQNARLRQHAQHGTPLMGAKLVASVPLNVELLWKQEFQRKTGHRATERGYGDLYRAFKLAKLDLPENRKFRVDDQKLGVKTDVGKIQVGGSVAHAIRNR